jgi:recombination protein RecA
MKKGAKKTAARKPSAKSESRTAAMARMIQSKFGGMSAAIPTGEQVIETVSTGVDVLDHYVLGRGGHPRGRILEIYGPEGSGKTSFGYQSIAQAQRAGGIGVWVESPGEGGIDESRAQVFGVDLDALLILRPATLEQSLDQMREVLTLHDADDGPMEIVWDSVAGMVTAEGQKRDAGNRKVGDVPLILSDELKKLPPLLAKHNGHLTAINQVRAKIGVMFGDNTTTPGGNALKFYASQRLAILGGKAVKDSKGQHTAKIVTLLAVKNRLGSPWRKAKVRLDYTTGFNNIWSTIWHAKVMKMIKCRADGFAGPSREGLAVYAEALEALGWQSRVPLPTEEEQSVVNAGTDDEPEDLDDTDDDDDDDDDDGDAD